MGKKKSKKNKNKKNAAAVNKAPVKNASVEPEEAIEAAEIEIASEPVLAEAAPEIAEDAVKDVEEESELFGTVEEISQFTDPSEAEKPEAEYVDFVLDEACVVVIDEPAVIAEPSAEGKKKKAKKKKEKAARPKAKAKESPAPEKAESEEERGEDFVLPAAPMVDIPYSETFTEEDFTASVKELGPEDISGDAAAPKKRAKRKISKTENIIQLGLLSVCGVVALVCIGLLVNNIWGKIRGQELYSNTEFDGFILGEENDDSDRRNLAKIGNDSPLLTLFEKINSSDDGVSEDTSGKYDEQLAQMRASLSALKAQNDDIYGWIYVENTNINHPVVRCDDNNYYLDHAYTGEYLPIGAIFADLTTKDLITDNYNTVIYGHNVVSTGQSSMFHDVEKFLDEEFFRNTKIYVYTMDGAFVYQPVAIYDTVADYFYFRTVFGSENDFLKFAQEMVKNSRIYSGAQFGTGDRMLTLSTCTNGATDGRYSLHAKLVEVIK